jgi:hypothetical protein
MSDAAEKYASAPARRILRVSGGARGPVFYNYDATI